jgi:hypothetical protein
MNILGPEFWRATAYEGPYAGHGPFIRFVWACQGCANVNLGRPVPQDNASQCLLAMRLLFESLLRSDSKHAANGAVCQSMNVVVESFSTCDYIGGEVVARVDIEVHDETAYASVLSTSSPRVRLKPAMVSSQGGAWELFVQLLSTL